VLVARFPIPLWITLLSSLANAQGTPETRLLPSNDRGVTPNRPAIPDGIRELSRRGVPPSSRWFGARGGRKRSLRPDVRSRRVIDPPERSDRLGKHPRDVRRLAFGGPEAMQGLRFNSQFLINFRRAVGRRRAWLQNPYPRSDRRCRSVARGAVVGLDTPINTVSGALVLAWLKLWLVWSWLWGACSSRARGFRRAVMTHRTCWPPAWGRAPDHGHDEPNGNGTNRRDPGPALRPPDRRDDVEPGRRWLRRSLANWVPPGPRSTRPRGAFVAGLPFRLGVAPVR
jgi:hypothetical protein